MPPNEGPECENGISPQWSPTNTPILVGTPPPDATFSDSEPEFQPSIHVIDFSPTINLFGRISSPLEHNLREILIKVTDREDLTNVTKVQLKVIAREVSLQHLGIHTPNLTELLLDGSVVTSLRDLGCGLKNLKVLHVARCGLTSFDGLFGLQTLEELHASDNQLENLYQCTSLPDLKVLDVRRNRLQTVSTINFLTLCEKLENLMMEGNQAVYEINYRTAVKKILPHLIMLDNLQFEESSFGQDSMDSCEDSESSDIVDSDIKDGCLKEIVAVDFAGSSSNTGVLPRIKQKSLRPSTSSGASSTNRGITSRPQSSRDTDITLPNIDSRRVNSPSSLTSGDPICGNVAAALRSRIRRRDAWKEE